MALSPGEEFRIMATPSQALLRKLNHLAQQGNDSVLTGSVKSAQNFQARDRAAKDDDGVLQTVQMFAAQERLRELNDRLDALDRASTKALREAQENLEEVRRTANRTRDGRLAFADEDGKIYDEDGNVVSSDEIDPAYWKSDGPTRDEFRAARDAADAAADYHRRVIGQKDRLNNNPSDDELDEIADELDALEAIMPNSNASAYQRPEGAAQFDTVGEAAPVRRSTSVAKDFDANLSSREISARAPFSRAVSGTRMPSGEEPGVTPNPGAPAHSL